jgi:osmotically-inducible protein OsmY
LVGIISRRDILRIIVDAPTTVLPKDDDAIRLAIRTRLRSDLGLTSQRVQVFVERGQVIVQGQVDSELKRKAVRALIESLKGAAGYVDRMSVAAI